jgi:hypothetical protein
MSQYLIPSPITVGGVGGSGTRLVTELLKRMNIFMGNELNQSNDNMQIASSFPSFRHIIQNHITEQRPKITKRLGEFEQIMQRDAMQQAYQGWGWKIPGNFFILEDLVKHFSQLTYIHTIRHGLDMAYSTNQNQLYNWGQFYGVDFNTLPLPNASLRYWINANKSAIAQGKKLLNERFFLLNFDVLCLQPRQEIKLLAQFLGIRDIDINKLSEIVVPPATLGRYKKQDLSLFESTDLDEVRKLGFSV